MNFKVENLHIGHFSYRFIKAKKTIKLAKTEHKISRKISFKKLLKHRNH